MLAALSLFYPPKSTRGLLRECFATNTSHFAEQGLLSTTQVLEEAVGFHPLLTHDIPLP